MLLNQYYTQKKYGDALVGSLSLASPNIALDLGFGTGNLLHAAKRRWKDISLVGLDIDKRNISKALRKKEISALELNGFNPDLPNIINDRFGDIDLLISNPPYFSHKLDKNCREILGSIGLLDCISKKVSNVPAELVFLAQNLRLLSPNGELGIIVPAGLISGQSWKPVREFLLTNYNVSNIMQLPVNSFKNTDAQTFVVILKLKTNTSATVKLSHINEVETITVNKKSAVERSDFSYYKEASKQSNSIAISSNDFVIYRGNRSQKDLSQGSIKHIHTTNMPKAPTEIVLDNIPLTNAKNAQKGDILIARVGRRCLGRVMHVMSGSIPISDCVIGIRPATPDIGFSVWEKLTSDHFKTFLTNASLGVGAKYITHKLLADYLTSNIYATPE